jgi:hypothetical protein
MAYFEIGVKEGYDLEETKKVVNGLETFGYKVYFSGEVLRTDEFSGNLPSRDDLPIMCGILREKVPGAGSLRYKGRIENGPHVDVTVPL